MATGNSKTKWVSQGTKEETTHLNSLQISLNYEGKVPEQEILATKPESTKIVWSGAKEGCNRLYFGDNLPILASFLQDPKVYGKVKLIYIDPPFATNSVFHSRKLADAYQDLLIGAHYLEFIRQRLVLLRELLADDGAIYVHLDENMAFHVKIIMDEIFGSKNFRNWITRKKCNPKNTARKRYGDVSDYIMFYSKSDQYTWNRPVIEWTDETALKEYNCIEPETGRRYKRVPIHAPGTRNGATGETWRGKSPPPGKHWQYTPDTLEEMDARGEIYWSSNGNPRRKIYLDDSAGVPVQDIWLDLLDIRNQNTKITGYPTEKNPDLLERIIQSSSNPGDLVLDCFAGSGTTLAVASKLNRLWIGIDNSKEAISTILHRFMVGTEPMGDFVEKSTVKTEFVPQTLFDMLEPEQEVLRSSNGQGVHSIMNFDLLTNDENSAILNSVIADWQAHK